MDATTRCHNCQRKATHAIYLKMIGARYNLCGPCYAIYESGYEDAKYKIAVHQFEIRSGNQLLPIKTLLPL